MKTEKKIEDITIFLDYEIRSSWWASLIGWRWGQDISGEYFIWKTRRKYKRYLFSKTMQAGLAIDKSKLTNP